MVRLSKTSGHWMIGSGENPIEYAAIWTLPWDPRYCTMVTNNLLGSVRMESPAECAIELSIPCLIKSRHEDQISDSDGQIRRQWTPLKLQRRANITWSHCILLDHYLTFAANSKALLICRAQWSENLVVPWLSGSRGAPDLIWTVDRCEGVFIVTRKLALSLVPVACHIAIIWWPSTGIGLLQAVEAFC